MVVSQIHTSFHEKFFVVYPQHGTISYERNAKNALTGDPMLRTVEDITARIVDAYEPDRIIAFGSGMTGTVPAGSDLDLLVVKDTSNRQLIVRWS